MGNRNHFLGPHFSFTKAVVRSLMGSGNSFVGLFKEKEQKLSLLLCSQCHHSHVNDNLMKQSVSSFSRGNEKKQRSCKIFAEMDA